MSKTYRIGTVFSRVDGLIRKGHLKENDRPLWFDVYKRFPPKYEPYETRKAPEVDVREIFYEEDRLRAKIHKKFEGKLRPFNLINRQESHSLKLMKTCQEYISQGMSEEDAIARLTESQTTEQV